MAYLDLEMGDRFARTLAPQSAPAPQVPPSGLSRVERTVVLLSLFDPIASLRTYGRFRTRVRWLFGAERTNPFADKRLEAIRRLAVSCRLLHGSELDQALHEAAEAGLDGAARDEIAQIVDANDVRRERTGAPLQKVGIVAALVLATMWLFREINLTFEDPMISAFVIGIGYITALSILMPRTDRPARSKRQVAA